MNRLAVVGLLLGIFAACSQKAGTLSVDLGPDSVETVSGEGLVQPDVAPELTAEVRVPCGSHADCEALSASAGPCHLAMCDQAVGLCYVGTMKDGTRCDDENPCTESTICLDGACGSGLPLACDDANPCTLDGCDPESGCAFVPLDGEAESCDDGNPCTQSDHCVAGACVGDASGCGCTTDDDCAALDDDDTCNGFLVCEAATCVAASGSIVACPPTASPCRKSECDAQTGTCLEVPLPEGTACQDLDPCTVGDSCNQGLCASGTENVCATCQKDEDCEGLEAEDKCLGKPVCDDGHCALDLVQQVVCPPKPCALVTCNPETGKCNEEVLADGTWCSDDDACTGQDKCTAGKCAGKPLPCDDGNSCTKDVCLPAAGCQFTNLSDIPCAATSLCTKESWCKNGKCVATAQVDCEDDNPCTEDSCNPDSGCEHQPSSGPSCDDSNPCTVDETCVEGTCEPGPNICDCKTDLHCSDFEDGNLCNGTLVCIDFTCNVDPESVVTCKTEGDTDCQFTTCNPLTGTCGKIEAPYGAGCDDGNACTVGETCFYGECLGGIELPCDDGNPCTNDTCAADQGCQFEPLGQGPCDDLDVCTTGDTCKGGVCTSDQNICNCKVDADCTVFEDSDLCNGTLACTAGVCLVKKGSVITCPAPASPCQSIACVKQTGECKTTNLPSGSPCSDGNACTTKDACYDGTCKGEETLCTDLNACTEDSCEPATGCKHSPSSDTLCEDGNPCTEGDTCSNGKCNPGINKCDCQTDQDCNDGDLDKCDGTMVCLQGKCTLDPKTVVKCDSTLDTPCTKNQCDPATGKCGMTQVPDGTVCDDKLFCSKNEVCQQGKCTGIKVDCSDGNPCTDDVCVEAQQGCMHLNNSLPCDDASLCTKNDLCKKGSCSGDLVSCDDSNVCTKDSCSPATGCQFAPADGSCDDGNQCTTGDACSQGKCVGQALPCNDDNPCTTDSCDPLAGCKHENNSLPCDDKNPCTEKDICQTGKCVAGFPKDCDDKNSCTADSCDNIVGCVNKPLSGDACSDGNPCTLNDSCVYGVCTAGALDPCDDKNPCTKDACNTDSGCAHTPLEGTSCSDNDACTTADKCSGGKCIGSPLSCNDNDVCTTDLCDPAKGCIFPPVSDMPPKSCDDGNKCTVGDMCTAGKCQAGPPPNCDDNNVCTTDVCAQATGLCTHVNNTQSCNDNNVCTQTDKCGGGKCVGSNSLACNDMNPCTNDSCDPFKGCQFVDNGTCECDAGSDCMDDGNKCNGFPTCVGGKCVVDPASIMTCPPNADTQCMKNKCMPATGLCAMTPEPVGTACNDGTACTTDDKCYAGGSCVGTALVCEDNNPCTDNKCLAASGCYFPPKAGACSDANACTVEDTCTNGACTGKPYDCNDNNPCTQDVCVPSNGSPSCSHPPASGPCDDSDQCTTGDVCVNGKCSGTPLVCSDGNACTTDTCDPTIGCVFAPVPDGTTCSDGNLCTAPDLCQSGTCKPGPWTIACCLVNADCGDSYACTTESCSNNKCSYALKNCAQSNDCLAGWCDAAGTCKSAPAQSAVTLYEQGFETGTAPGWLFGINTGGSPDIYWSVDAKRAAAGKFSLYVGNPKDYSYNHGVGNAVALSPPIALPAGMGASVKFKYYSLVFEAGCGFDYLLLQVHDHLGNISTLTPMLCDPTTEFVSTAFDLSAWSGKTVRIGLVFQTKDDLYNTGEGIFVDEFAVGTEAVKECCSFDSHCEDADLCTQDLCSDYKCTYPAAAGSFFQEDFEAGSIAISDSLSKTEYWYVTTNNADVTWTVDDFKSFSTPYSLYAGNPKAHTYDYGATITRIRSPLIKVPSDSYPQIRFRAWLGLADTNCNDAFKVGYTTALGDPLTWLSTYCTPSPGGFQEYVVALPAAVAAAGQVMVQLQFVADGSNNKATGVFVDNLRVDDAKAASCCKVDSGCVDLTDCTVDACEGVSGGGICFHHKVGLLQESFDDGSAQGWTFESTNPSVTWSVSDYRSNTPKHSLYCGKKGQTYVDFLAGKVMTATPDVYLDNVLKLTPQVTYTRWLQLYASSKHCFTAELLDKSPGSTTPPLVLETVCGDSLPGNSGWVNKSFSISAAYKGRTVAVRFVLQFTSVLVPPSPSPEGAYIDNVLVGYQSCK